MISLKAAAGIMENTTAYRLWQAPFVHDKFEPVLRHNGYLANVRRVLDVGCGPGTNCPYFEGIDYLGIDINPGYIDDARRKYNREFQVADATQLRPSKNERYDFVLLNSLLHHIDDAGCDHLLDSLTQAVSDDGHVHIIDLVLPPERGIPRFLAINDRGDYSRPLSDWRALFERFYQTVVFEPFSIELFGASLWNLVYFKGRAKR